MQSVVNGFRNVCMAAVVAAFAGCSGGDAVNSLERMGLRGNVRSLDVSAYEAKACGGTVTKGSRVDDMQSCCSYRFDERGYVTGTEYLCGGHVVKWEEFVYDGSGRPERIVSRSVRAATGRSNSNGTAGVMCAAPLTRREMKCRKSVPSGGGTGPRAWRSAGMAA